MSEGVIIPEMKAPVQTTVLQCPDMRTAIYQYLEGRDLLPLDARKPEINMILTSRVIARLAKLGLDNQFIQLLIENTGLIAGSFVLQCLLGVTWDTDIDIYFQSEATSTAFSSLEDYLWHRSNHVLYSSQSYSQLQGIRRVRQYTIGKLRVQVINLDTTETPRQHVKNKFDLQFCMSMFNGKMVDIPFPRAIVDMTSEYRPQNRYYITYKCMVRRINKYRARGFTIPYPLFYYEEKDRYDQLSQRMREFHQEINFSEMGTALTEVTELTKLTEVTAPVVVS